MNNCCEYLRRFDLFSTLPSEALNAIASNFTQSFFPENMTIVKQGQAVDHVLYIVSGSAKVVIESKHNRQCIFGLLKAGDIHAGPYLFFANPSTVSVVTMEPVNCFIQSREDFMRMIQAFPQIKDVVYQNVMERMWEGFYRIQQPKAHHPPPEAGGDRMPELVRQALACIDTHYKEAITLDCVSKKIGVSRCHLSRLFNRHTGMSFNTYLNRRRIEAAKEMMATGDMNATEAGFSVGYNDMSYFSRVFKRIEGISPSTFRKTS